MRKRHLFVAVAIIMAALVFFTCDLLKPVDGSDDNQDTYSPLVITGIDDKNKSVIITFTRPVQADQKAVVTLFPQDGDNYEIKYDGQLFSSGFIAVSGTTPMIITFISESGSQFTGTYGGGKNLSFQNGRIDTTPTAITGFQLDNGNNGGNAEAIKIANAWGNNAEVVGSIVYINGDITVLSDITISDKVTLIFNARDINSFTIGTANSNVRVTVKGGIMVSEGRGVTLKGPTGTLVVEGEGTMSSVISGKLIVDEYATLDIAGDATIAAGGVLELKGYDTVNNVAENKYNASRPYIIKLGDAKFILRGSMVVENGGRFQMPDPWKYEIKYITGLIVVKPGGELILVTSDHNGNPDLHPLIGTVFTTTQGPPIAADFVMTPGTIDPNTRIEVRISGDKKPIPALELTGSATALGRLILDENHKVSDADVRVPPYRFDVWLNYPFTVTASGSLFVGNSVEPKFRSSLLVTGNYFDEQYPTAATAGIFGIKKGINKGVLTNYGRISIYEKNGILEWYGGLFDNRNSVKSDGKDIGASSTVLTDFPTSSGTNVYIRVWSTGWKTDEDNSDEWWLEFLDKTTSPNSP